MRRGIFVLFGVMAMTVAGYGQRFEAASIKPTTSPDGRSLLQALPGRLTMRNIALKRLILIAWDVQDYQVAGDPAWTGSEHYDVQAKADGNASAQEMEGPMLQALLEERFRLRVHRETRQVPVYELSIASGGAKLQRSTEASCVAPGAACGFHLTTDGLNRTLEVKGVTMEMLAGNLSRSYNSSLGRNVFDKTGLAGAFDVRLAWTIDPLNPDLAAELTAPSIRGALQEQLGLKLESTKAAAEVLIIDHIEKPSAN
jgi:uncharacterized protein (TIGR03435 family)